jgi:hypothetical protein
MELNLILVILIFGLIFSSTTALAELSEAAQLRIQCEAERQKKLAPLREQEIEKCVQKRNN